MFPEEENKINCFFPQNQLLNNYWMTFLVIFRTIKGEVSVISRSRRLRLITLIETLIILEITKTEFNNWFIIHWKSQINYKTAMKNKVPQNVFTCKYCANRVFYSGFEAFLSLRYSWNTCLYFHWLFLACVLSIFIFYKYYSFSLDKSSKSSDCNVHWVRAMRPRKQHDK